MEKPFAAFKRDSSKCDWVEKHDHKASKNHHKGL